MRTGIVAVKVIIAFPYSENDRKSVGCELLTLEGNNLEEVILKREKTREKYNELTVEEFTEYYVHEVC